MTSLLTSLMRLVKVAIISGGDLPQFQKQLVARLPQDDLLAQLSLLPPAAHASTSMNPVGRKLYSEDLSEAQKTKIVAALNDAVKASGFGAERTWAR